jgi:hypothetical protein
MQGKEKHTFESQHFIAVHPASMVIEPVYLKINKLSTQKDWEKWLLDVLEDAWGVFVQIMKFPKPHDTIYDEFRNTPEKKNVKVTVLINDTSDFQAVIGSKDGLANIRLSRPSAVERVVVVHELGHVMTVHTRSWTDQVPGGHVGLLWESLAEWFVLEYFLINKEMGRSQDVPILMAMPKRWTGQQIYFGHMDTSYGEYLFFHYLYRNPDQFKWGEDLMLRVLTNRKEGDEAYTVIIREINVSDPSFTLEQLFGYYYRRFALLDFPLLHTEYMANFKTWCADNKKPELNSMAMEKVGKSWAIKGNKAPQHGGFNVITLKPAPGSTKITLTIAQTDENSKKYGSLTASLFRYDSTTAVATYSDLSTEGSVCSIDVDPSAQSQYGFVVSGILKEPYYPYAVPDAATLDAPMRTHMPYRADIAGAEPTHSA